MNNSTYRPLSHVGKRGLDYALSPLLVWLEKVEAQNVTALKAQRPHCQHCAGTDESDDTFDHLCPYCTPTHCVMCGNTKAPIEAGNYRYCRSCARQEEREL